MGLGGSGPSGSAALVVQEPPALLALTDGTVPVGPVNGPPAEEIVGGEYFFLMNKVIVGNGIFVDTPSIVDDISSAFYHDDDKMKAYIGDTRLLNCDDFFQQTYWSGEMGGEGVALIRAILTTAKTILCVEGNDLSDVRRVAKTINFTLTVDVANPARLRIVSLIVLGKVMEHANEAVYRITDFANSSITMNSSIVSNSELVKDTQQVTLKARANEVTGKYEFGVLFEEDEWGLVKLSSYYGNAAGVAAARACADLDFLCLIALNGYMVFNIRAVERCLDNSIRGGCLAVTFVFARAHASTGLGLTGNYPYRLNLNAVPTVEPRTPDLPTVFPDVMDLDSVAYPGDADLFALD